MGGLHPAYEFTKELLMSGKSVVTSNKELVATYGTELLELAKKNNVSYLFEASVGGGIPIIRALTNSLTQENVVKIAGILNGTTNYILTQMFENGKSFDEALKDAQELGYAEKNPAADVEGYDACRKIAILSSLAWGKFTDYNNIPTEGITKITEEDVKCAEMLDSVIKLIGYAECDADGKVTAMVRPMMIKKVSPLAGVSDVFNAVLVTGDSLGDAMFYGKGAGKLATASAVMADIIDAVKHCGENTGWTEEKTDFMKPADECPARFMVRVDKMPDAQILKNSEIVNKDNQICMITDMICEKDLRESLKDCEVLSLIRILEV